MLSPLTEPVPPAQKDAALLNLGWQPEHLVVDVSSGELPALPPETAADWITFFGPFLTLPDLEIFRRLEAAKALLKADGRIVFSFLDYDVPQHWQIFRQTLTDSSQPVPNFLNRGTIEAWAIHLGLALEYHYSGEVAWLQPLQSGAVEASSFGQSVAVLALPSASD